MKKKRIILIILLLFLCLLLPGFYNACHTVTYTISAEGITQPIRIALVTDLHSCAYGQNQQELLDAIDAQDPDLILLGGDIFDDDLPDENAVAFLQGVSRQYPCFYVTGNHEYWSGKESFEHKMTAVKQSGIYRLSGGMMSVEIKGTHLNICGVDDPSAWDNGVNNIEYTEGSFRDQVAQVAVLPKEKAYTILLTHRPELLDVYSQYDFDLVLSGHAHGGQWRIPGILNGLWAPNQGLFPTYAGGRYEQNGTVMIVSRGLARESTRIPRFYNRPELVIVEIRP